MRNDTALDVRWPAKFNEIPKEVFHRADVYRLELERIFHGPEWHPVAHFAEVPKPGDLKTGYVGETPVLIVHGDDGVVRVFQNSCPHRGTPLDWLPDRFLDRGGRHILCATHGALFRIEDGFCLSGPCAGARLRRVAITPGVVGASAPLVGVSPTSFNACTGLGPRVILRICLSAARNGVRSAGWC